MIEIKPRNQNDIKRLILSHPSFKRINRQTTILRNLDGMTIFFKDFDCQLLINKIVLCEKDIKGNVVWRRYRADGVGFQSGNESRRKVLSGDRSSYLRTDAVVQTPLDYLQTNIK